MNNFELIAEEINKTICSIAQINELKNDMDFFQSGIDSLTLIKCIVKIEQVYNIKFSDSELSFEELSDVNKIAMRVADKLKECGD